VFSGCATSVFDCLVLVPGGSAIPEARRRPALRGVLSKVSRASIVLRLGSATTALALLVLLFTGEEKWRVSSGHQLERDSPPVGEKLLTRVNPPP